MCETEEELEREKESKRKETWWELMIIVWIVLSAQHCRRSIRIETVVGVVAAAAVEVAAGRNGNKSFEW